MSALRNSVDLQKATRFFWILFSASTIHCYFNYSFQQIFIWDPRELFAKTLSHKKKNFFQDFSPQSVNSQLYCVTINDQYKYPLLGWNLSNCFPPQMKKGWLQTKITCVILWSHSYCNNIWLYWGEQNVREVWVN